MSDAEQDFGSNYGDEEEEVANHMADLRSRDWSPKQYSVSSNEEDEPMDAEDAILSPSGMRDPYSSEDLDDEEEQK